MAALVDIAAAKSGDIPSLPAGRSVTFHCQPTIATVALTAKISPRKTKQKSRVASGATHDSGNDKKSVVTQKSAAAAEGDDASWDENASEQQVAALQARRLYAALTYSSEHEREAYRRNKTEQTRLNMVLEHIGLQRAVTSKSLDRDMTVMKVRGSRIEERAKQTAQGAAMASTSSNACSTSSYIRSGSGSFSNSRSMTAISQMYRTDRSVMDDEMLALPDISESKRSGRRSVRALTFISENASVKPITAITNNDMDDVSRPQRSLFGPKTSQGLRGNASRYIDTSSPRTTPRKSASDAVVRGSKQSDLRQRTVQAYQTADSNYNGLRSSLHQQKQKQKQPTIGTNKQKPLLAILAGSAAAVTIQSRTTKAVLEASKSLDADIDAVLNMRVEDVAGEPRKVPSSRSKGIGLRQPANFNCNYRPCLPLSEDEEEKDVAADKEPLTTDGEELEEENLRSMTSCSGRPNIDRIATPSSNTFRVEGFGRKDALSAGHPQASMGLQGELQCHYQSSQRRRLPPGHDHGPKPLNIQNALRREKTNMRQFEDKLDAFYRNLKGVESAKRSALKQNHWDLRGLDEKLMFY